MYMNIFGHVQYITYCTYMYMIYMYIYMHVYTMNVLEFLFTSPDI